MTTEWSNKSGKKVILRKAGDITVRREYKNGRKYMNLSLHYHDTWAGKNAITMLVA
jgi:hypothetical protein